MASRDRKQRKCFTFLWQLENVNYVLLKEDDGIISPRFTIDELGNMNWRMILACLDEENHEIGLQLTIEADAGGEETVEIDYDLAILLDGRVEHSQEITKRSFVRNEILTSDFNELPHILCGNLVVPQDILTIRCRIWKSVGEFSEDVSTGALTSVEKSSFLWEIRNFRAFEPKLLSLYDVKSMNTLEKFMTLGLILTEEETIRIFIIRYDGRIFFLRSQLSLVDSFGNAVKSLEEKIFMFDATHDSKFLYTLEKAELLEKKDIYLPKEILQLKCEFTFGIITEKMENVNYGSTASENSEMLYLLLGRQTKLSSPKRDLMDNFKSMLNNGCHSDIKLRTDSKIYPVHKCILSSRSPVFKTMFENEMKENLNQCVDITDLSDDTILRMLQFIYCANVEEMEWGSAIQLYEAADKYEILSLKDICSSYLKSNLHRSNVCEALVMADLHQDNDLKGFSQNFILRHGVDIINSEDWKKMMQTHLKLAAETMCLKFKK